MKLYYLENITRRYPYQTEAPIEQFYVVDTGYGVIEMYESGSSISYDSLKEFKEMWNGDFDKWVIMVEVL